MPTYDYKCQACGHEMEAFQSMSAKPLRKCPECGKLKLKRLIGTGAGVIFKGSGFWQTDYRSESYKAGEKKAKEAQESSSKSSEKKSESKSDSKSSGDAKKSAPKKETKAAKKSD